MKSVLNTLLVGTLALGLTIFSSMAGVRSVQDHAETRYGYFIDNDRKIAKIPFEFYSNLIMIPLILNKTDTLRFILDTGVGSIIITDPSKVTRAQMRSTRRIALNGTGSEESIVANVTIGNTIQIGEMRANLQNIVMFDEDILKLAEIVGVPVHGILGYELFNNFVVTVDFLRKQLILHHFEAYHYRKKQGEKYRIDIQDSKPFTNITSLVLSEKEYPIRVLIDTGSGHAMMMDYQENTSLLVPSKKIDIPLGRGLNGTIKGSVGRIEKIRIGSTVLKQVVATFPEEEAFGAKIPDRYERHGNIGCELLRRFKVTFHYRDGYMVLKPIKKRLKESFEHDMSGMEVRATGTDYQSFVVSDVLHNSPADEAGIRIGDELLFINERPSTSMHISELYKLFQKRHGDRVNLILKREGQPVIFTQLRLRRII